MGQALPYDTAGLTPTQLAWSATCTNSGPGFRDDEWFEFIAPAGGTFRATTCGGQDCALELFRGGCAALSLIECDGNRCRDDDPFARGGKVYFQADAGEVIHLRVGSWLPGLGSVSGSLLVEPFTTVSNDACASPLPITAGAMVPIDLFEATAGGDPVPCGDPSYSDLWFEFIPTVTGTYEASTCGFSAGFNLAATSIAHYSGTCQALVLEGCSSGGCGFRTLHSFQAVAGQRYLLRVMGYGYFSYGPLSLVQVGGAADDECAGATPIVVGAFEPYALDGATPSSNPWSCSTAVVADVWRTVVLPQTGSYWAYCYTLGAPANLALAAYTGDCANPVLLDCAQAGTPQVRFYAAAGTVIKLRVGANASAGVNGHVRLVLGPPNDRCTEATFVPLETLTAFQTGEASTSPVPWTCTSVNEADIWFRFTATATGPLRVVVCEQFSSLDTIEVYSGGCSNLVSVACQAGTQDCTSNAAVVQAVAGNDYWVRVNDANYNASGDILITAVGPPPNDDCSGAFDLVPGLPLPVDLTSASNAGSGWQIFGCSNSTGADLFYRFVAATSGRYSFRTCFSEPGVDLGVFTGTCASHTALGCGLQRCAAGAAFYGSTFETHIAAGSTYILRVSSTAAVPPVGTIEVVQGAPPVNDLCSGALPVGIGSHAFDLSFATPSGMPHADCGGAFIGSSPYDIWFRFTSPAGGPTAVLLCDSPYSVLLSVYDSGACSTATPILCSSLGGGFACGLSTPLVPGAVFPATAGQDYLIRITNPLGHGFVGTLTINDGFTTGVLGSPYCLGAVNSTGLAARLSANGNASVIINSLALEAVNLPPLAYAFFLTSRDQGFVPNIGGGAGNLCLGGSIGRYNSFGQIQRANAAGMITFPVSLASFPQGFGNFPGIAGETWNWQLWYRDTAAGPPASNLTNGLELTLE